MRSLVAISTLGGVAGVFAWRYGARVLDYPGLAAALGTLALIAILLLLRQVDFGSARLARSGRVYAAAVLLLAVAATLVVTLTPEGSRVARLPALADWLSTISSGDFPWEHHVNAPSPFPFLYVIAWPFYEVDNLGLLEVIGILGFGLVIWFASDTPNARWLRLGTALLLPPLYYEPIVRSELLFNTVLVIALILIAERALDPARLDARAIGLAVAFGLVLSTRAVVGLMYACYLAYRFRSHIRQGLAFVAIVALVLAITLLPFVIWDAGDFFSNGPLTSQSRGSELPAWAAVLAVLAALLAGWTARTLPDVFLRLGLILFLVVVAALLPKVIEHGDSPILANPGYDLGYFVFCVPFLVLCLNSARDGDRIIRPPDGAGSSDAPA